MRQVVLILAVLWSAAQARITDQPWFFDSSEETCLMNTNCVLPFCHCESSRAPLVNASLSRMPQLVVLTIDDDALDIKSYQVYKKLFEKARNPNGCALRGTIFLSDTYNRTSYCLVRDLYDKRFEIAVSTLNYTCPHRRCSPLPDFQPWHYTKWSEQIFDIKTRLVRYAGIARSDVVGFRAPLLEPSSDLHFRIIAGNHFLYDSSLVMNTPDLLWPFTLDYKVISPMSNNGPINSYPGLWEIPVPTYIDLENSNSFSLVCKESFNPFFTTFLGAILISFFFVFVLFLEKEKCLKIWEGHCSFDRSTDGIAKFMRHHFLRAYYNNKAPVVFHLNAEWLKEFVITNTTEIIPNVGFAKPETTRIRLEKKEYRNLNGLMKFINQTLESNRDVYFVSAYKAIQWMQALKRIEVQNYSPPPP